MKPEEATTSPDDSSHRWPAMVVEPISTARPNTWSLKPGQTPVICLPRCTATVTVHLPLRKAACNPWITRRSVDEVGEAPLLLQRLLQALQVAGRVVHVGLGDLDVVQLHDRIDLDRAHLGALAHHLLVDLAVLRHVDDEVALQHAPGSDRRRPGFMPRLSA